MNVIFLILGFIFLYYPATLALGFWLRHETPFDQPADVAIVMGSVPRKALPRIQTAVNLYHLGLVKKLILTGKPLIGDLTEARWLEEQALKLGVSKDDILIEERATNSKENMLFSKPFIEQNNFETVVIVQQEFSQIRGHYTAKKTFADLNVKVLSQPASSAPYWDRWTWMFHKIGWQYTWKTVSRLIKYRLKGDL